MRTCFARASALPAVARADQSTPSGSFSPTIERNCRIEETADLQNALAAGVHWLEPDEVIVADKEDGQTRFTRADTLDLAEWLAEYDLRDLWQMGHLGGRV